jgi:hypothetical protein
MSASLDDGQLAIAVRVDGSNAARARKIQRVTGGSLRQRAFVSSGRWFLSQLMIALMISPSAASAARNGVPSK